MVFFNYSTMQMAAKIVYYGPGLCGKTTNLQHIYGHTSKGSRGEMVSLETETDRTLFFDLLPIDVGSIQGFDTRIQLYTVPGQVFYNTTRKLVLKGVDGVVFVADSQRPMVQANKESFANLEENLAEIGLSVDELPLVLQYNKRDLKDICTVEELNEAINRGNWPHFEASALKGTGVFETLKGISKLTLLSLKKRIAASQETNQAQAGRATPQPATEPKPIPPAAAPQPATPEPAPTATNPAVPSPAPEPSPASAPVAASSAVATAQPKETPRSARSNRRGVDILAELEKIRRQSFKAASETAAHPAANGKLEISREIAGEVERANLSRTTSCNVALQFHDRAGQLIHTLEEGIALEDLANTGELLLRLKIAVSGKE